MRLHAITRTVDPLAFHGETRKLFGEFLGATNVNLGCGRNPEPGFINLDRVAGPTVDVVCDLEAGVLPFETGSVDCVLASHVLEHITGIIPLLREIHRVLTPGGHLLAVTPYASSDDAVEDPTHVRYFTERSWMYFDRRLYAREGYASAYTSPVDFAFDIVRVGLTPYEDVVTELAGIGIDNRKVALDFGRRFLRNVIKEMHAILRKVGDDA